MDIDRDRYIAADMRLSRDDVLHEWAEHIDGFDILLQCVTETDSEFGDMTDADREELYARIEGGDLVEFRVVVTCSQLGQLLAEDYLGSCIYKTYEEFHNDHRDYYYMDMVRQTISGAQDRIHSLKGFNHD